MESQNQYCLSIPLDDHILGKQHAEFYELGRVAGRGGGWLTHRPTATLGGCAGQARGVTVVWFRGRFTLAMPSIRHQSGWDLCSRHQVLFADHLHSSSPPCGPWYLSTERSTARPAGVLHLWGNILQNSMAGHLATDGSLSILFCYFMYTRIKDL